MFSSTDFMHICLLNTGTNLENVFLCLMGKICCITSRTLILCSMAPTGEVVQNLPDFFSHWNVA